jgi:prepilin-type N-terminal cleavage/methylation domain-containing protein
MPAILPVRPQAGFTLVETAITLTIIGLLIGGVIKSQDLITNARLKRMEKDSTGISIVIYAYQDRYGVLPGDDIKAASRFSVYDDGINDPAANDINGNGDGWIEGNWIGAANSETANFWKHLRAAGLVLGSGDDDTQPKNVFDGNIGVRDDSLQISGRVIVFGMIDGHVAAILESRQDDGNPSSGKIQSDLSAQLIDGSAGSTAGASYSESSRYFMSIKI